MSSRELLTRRQILLLVGVNALISAVISLAVGLLLTRTGTVAVGPTATITVPPTRAVLAPSATPATIIHVVQAGDTISGLALQYDVPEADIIAANNLSDPNALQVGMELIIPVGGLPQITPTWTPNPTPTETKLPYNPPSADLTATALALAGVTATSLPALPGSTATVTATGVLQVEITEVVGAGNADREAVVIVNKGKQVADMRNWTLGDANGNVFTFADLRLWPGGSVTVNTRIGTNGNPAFNFFWGKLQPIWTIGEVATLRDAAGGQVATFTVK